ncbi:ABC transporter substrate-binding protein [Hymenobacter sp. BT770]|uniref:ABC transporter substrate-binding protein n=1 Tax=Hymenobacter sp. BT770 TaxID=2886942 RepID=UPI001D121CDC|nr:ABC transporter substrate-binding protein [Hymenobacter sp. BT770]MCC3151783.1 ABC transporter substrate-binding protein [Hymenobacter sp. BT770]MDO3413595.1 ABC transporter substrate-binding protein [Hymenobacter sp. BT770]
MLQPNQAAIDANNLLHVCLLQPDIANRKYGPALATSLPAVELVGDSLSKLAYDIRPTAAWDNGRPVTARDVEFTLKLMFCPGLPNEVARNRYRFIRAVLTDLKAPQHFTLVCRGQALEYVEASGDFFILPEAAFDPRGQLRRFSLVDLQKRATTAPPDSALQSLAQRYQAAEAGHPGQVPGCGPYQLVKWEKDRYLTFRRKPQWWADRLQPVPIALQARPKQLDYVIIPDAATATLALRRGDIDVYPQIPAREFARLRASPAAAALNFYSTTSYDVVMAGFNTRRAHLNDALTRQALSRFFDAAGLLKATQLGDGQRTVGVISPIEKENYNDSLALIPFDPAGATALLRQAGWQRGPAPGTGWTRKSANGDLQQLRLAMRYRAEGSLFSTVALQFQAAAAGLDIPVTLQPTESGAFSSSLKAGDFDVYVGVRKGNPFMFNFTPVFHSLGIDAGNTTGFSSPASDQLIEAIAAADSKTHRSQLLRRFQALLQQEAPIVPLFFLPNRIVASRQLTNLHVGSLKPGFMATTIERVPKPSAAP